MSPIMARNTHTGNTFVRECRWSEHRGRVAHITILVGWQMIYCFCRDRAIGGGELTVMTAFAATCNVNVNISIKF